MRKTISKIGNYLAEQTEGKFIISNQLVGNVRFVLDEKYRCFEIESTGDVIIVHLIGVTPSKDYMISVHAMNTLSVETNEPLWKTNCDKILKETYELLNPTIDIH